MVGIPIAFDAGPIIFPLLLDSLKDLAIWLLELPVKVISGIFHALAALPIREFLFIKNPSEIEMLTSLYWDKMFPLFWGLLAPITAVFLLSAQLLPQSSEADIDRFMQRSMIAVILLFIFPIAFPLIIDTVNTVGTVLYPDEFLIDVDILTAEGLATTASTGLAVIMFAFIFNTTIVFTFGIFLAILAMRMVIIYAFYGLFPVLIAFWIVDIGPAKYTKMFAGLMFKMCAYLLLLGIILSAILGVGGAMAGGESLNDMNLAIDGDGDELYISDSQKYTPAEEMNRTASGILAEDSDGQLTQQGGGVGGGEGPSTITSAWTRVFSFFATLWICIAIVGGTLGMAISTGFTAHAKKQTFGAKFADAAKTGINRFRKDDQPSIGEDNTVTTDGETTHIRTEDGRITIDEDGTIRTESADEPTNVDPGETVQERAKYGASKIVKGIDKVSGGRLSSGKESLEQVGANGKEFGSSAKELGKDMGSKVPGSSKAAWSGKRVGALSKSGAKSWGRVFKQKNVVSSAGEAIDIMRESPMAHPEKERFGADSQSDIELEGSDTPLEDLKEKIENDEDFEQGSSQTINELKRLTYMGNTPETFTPPGEDEDHKMQRGKFVNEDNDDEEMYTVSFKTDEGAPELDHGETYNLKDVSVKSWNVNKERAHHGAEHEADEDGYYNQIKLTQNSTAEKVTRDSETQEGGEIEDTGSPDTEHSSNSQDSDDDENNRGTLGG